MIIMIFLMLILSTAIYNFFINIKLQQIQPQCIMQNKYTTLHVLISIFVTTNK